MEKIKKISAALIAMTMACGMMASCGDEASDDKGDSKEKTTTTTAAEVDADASEDTAESEAEAEESKADEPAEPVEAYVPQYDYVGYDAFLMFADMNWFWGNWLGQGYVHNADFDATDPGCYGYGVDADIVGDGEYTVAITKSSIDSNNGVLNANMDTTLRTDGPAAGTVVFCVDIVGLLDGTEISGLNKDTGEWEITAAEKNKLNEEGDNHYDKKVIGDYKTSDIKVEVTSIKCDGKEVAFDPTKIRYGNIEDDNNCYRIEIYNSYGSTVSDPAFDPIADINFAESLEVTFTIEGLGEIKTFPEVEPFTPAE